MTTEFIWFFSVMAAIMLFLHGLAAFSDEVTRLGGDRLHALLKQITRTDWRGAIVGAIATAVVQSSSAVTSMALGLAHSKALTQRGAIAIMIGANVGTTLTAWLVAMKVEGLGPVFVTLGGLWSLMGIRPWRAYGKAVFYFGLIFLALDLIGQGLAPLAQSNYIAEWHSLLESPVIALLFGALLTAIVQSSSVVSGLAVLLVLQGVIAPQVAVWMVAGSNVGTTSTALLASGVLDTVARKLALLNTAFNVFGVLLFSTVLQPVVHYVLASNLAPIEQVAMVHTVFNLITALVTLMLLPLVWSKIELWLMAKETNNLV
ncbi:MAG: Na/Pi symporter [Methylophilus sp.]|nr:Na/Pi symporter [Methylophilus sp.]